MTNNLKVKGGEEIMRKTFILMFLIIACVALISGSAYALTGVCSNCHTMHNSQDGLFQAQVYSAGSVTTSTTPLGHLLKGDCLACHTATAAGAATIDSNNAPIVFNTAEYPSGAKGTPTAPLAGGNFYGASDDASRHNVDFVVAPDGVLGNTPPGTTTPLGSQLTCAGANGCHGDRNKPDNYSAISGAHHSNIVRDNSEGVGTVAQSFRFLIGIKGAEDDNWEQSADSGDHNGYQGGSNFTNTTTISYLCGECHGDFHSAAGVGSSALWLRHPTDVTIAALSTDYQTYDIDVPVALATPSTSTYAVDGTSIVICLSCHSAHGTQNDDILKWNYDSSAGAGPTVKTKCLECHLKQR
jgi:hypothetical protein